MGGIFTNILGSLPGIGLLLGNGFRPPQWSEGIQLVSLTAKEPVVSSSQTTTNVSSAISFEGDLIGQTAGTTQTAQDNTTSFKSTTYYFDAVFREDHVQELRMTEHPVQNGPTVSDHAILMPMRIVLEVGVSDAMDSFISGQYDGYDSKSRGFYIKMRNLQQLRIPLVLTTRLSVYENLLIESIRAHVDVRTLHAFRGTIILRQVFMGTVDQNVLSARPNQTVETSPGASGVLPIPQNLQQYQNNAGQWSSNIPLLPSH